MTVFVSPPNRLPALLPSTAHPAGLIGIPCSLLWGRLRMSGLHTSLSARRVTNPSICSRKPLFFLNFALAEVDEYLGVRTVDVQKAKLVHDLGLYVLIGKATWGVGDSPHD